MGETRIESLSVIIPTYNRCTFLEAALVSAYHQRGVIVEVIVVDDGSTDGTLDVLERLNLPVKVLTLSHRGVSAARNAGLEVASHEFIIFLDSDDVILPDKARLQINSLRSSCGSVSYSRWRTLSAGGEILREPGQDWGSNMLPTLLVRHIAPPSACLFRADAVRAIGGFDEELSACNDWALLVQLALRAFSFVFCPESTALYRLHGGNMSYDKERSFTSAVKVVQKAFASSRLPDQYRRGQQHALAIQYLETARQCFVIGDSERAQEYVHRLLHNVDPARDWLVSSGVRSGDLNSAQEVERFRNWIEAAYFAALGLRPGGR